MENVTKIETGYYKKPYAMNKIGLSRCQSAIAGLFSSYTAEGKACAMGYKKLEKTVGTSRSTIARSIKKLESMGIIRRERYKTHTVYEFLPPDEFDLDTYMRIELWLHSKQFNINGVLRNLVPSEIDVYGLIYTHCNNKKNLTGEYVGSTAIIAALLELSRPTVCNAIRALLNARLIFRPEKALNGHGLSHYKVNRDFVRCVQKEQKKQKKSEQESPQETEQKKLIRAVDERAERERYYAALKDAAERVAERNEHRAFANLEYKEVVAQISEKELEAAKKEAFNLAGLPELLSSIERLKVRKTAILAGMGMTEQDMIPQYHCKECEDSGFRKTDGIACSCYLKR